MMVNQSSQVGEDRDTNPDRYFPLVRSLQAMSNSLLQPLKATNYCVYCIFTERSTWRIEDLQDLFEQLQSLLLLLGAFNGHSLTWAVAHTCLLYTSRLFLSRKKSISWYHFKQSVFSVLEFTYSDYHCFTRAGHCKIVNVSHFSTMCRYS